MVKRAPSEAAFEVVAVLTRAQAPGRRVGVAIAAALLVVLAALSGNLLSEDDGAAGAGPAVTPSPLPLTAATRPSPGPDDLAIDPGDYAIAAGVGSPIQIGLTMPAGWLSTSDGTAVYRVGDDAGYPYTSRPSLAVHAVSAVVADACRSGGPTSPFVEVGPTVDDLVAALMNVAGLETAGPTGVVVGGRAAQRLDLRLPRAFLDECGRPDGRWLWANAIGEDFWLSGGLTATVYILEIDGGRLVLATKGSGASPADDAELKAMIASIEFERTARQNAVKSAIEPGRYSITLPPMRVHLTMPAGWSSAAAGTAVWKSASGWQYVDFGRPTLAVQAVARVATTICRLDHAADQFAPIGPTFEDMTTALTDLVELQVSDPVDVVIGDYPARRVSLTFSPRFGERCGGPEGRWLWKDAFGAPFGLLVGGTATIYGVDVGGESLVIATVHRGASAEDLAQLDAMIASIELERETRPNGEVSPAGNWLLVDGVPLSFRLPPSRGGWAPGPIEKTLDGSLWNGSLLISKSTVGPQGAEAVIYWTAFPDGQNARLCSSLLSRSADPTAGDLAAAVATAAGTELVSGPSDVIVGGRPAKQVVLTVREDLGCDPGYFYAWPGECWGPCWMTTDIGTAIRVWIVDVDGKRLFIAGETHENAGPELDQQILDIVGSIQFE